MLAIRSRWSLVQRTFSVSSVSRDSQSLARLLRRGEYAKADKARRVMLSRGETIAFDPVYGLAARRYTEKDFDSPHKFLEWLDLLPEVEDDGAIPYPVPFPELAQRLLRHPTTFMDYIKIYSLVSVKKGYIQFWNSRCKPILEQHCTQEEFQRFLGKVENALAAKEDSYWDVIEEVVMGAVSRRLPAFLNEPNVEESTWLDDVSDDYGPSSDEADSRESRTSDLTQTVFRLLADQKDQEAYDILEEMTQSGFHIPLSPKFEESAIRVLQCHHLYPSSDEDDNPLLTRFKFWFSLIPPISEHRVRRFRKIHHLLLEQEIADVALAMEFGLIAASKGYGEEMQVDIIPFIMRYSNLETAGQFLVSFLEANNHFWSQVDGGGIRPWGPNYSPNGMKRRIHRIALGRAIRCLATSHRIEEAVDMLTGLPHPQDVAPRTYITVLRTLETANKLHGKFTSQIELVQSKYDESIGIDDADEGEGSTSHLVEHPDRVFTDNAWHNSLATQLSGQQVVKADGSLAQRLRFLKRILTTQTSPNALPHPFTIGQFMEDCTLHGRSRCLNLLRKRLLRTNRAGAALFAFAEMLFYYRRQSFGLVVLTFVRHFYFVGLPTKETLQFAGDVQRSPKRYGVDKSAFLPPRSEFASFRKLHPSPPIIALAWHGLVRGTPGIRALSNLYQKLLNICHGRPERDDVNVWERDGQLLAPLKFSGKMDRATFMPFMRPFSLAYGPGRGAAILKDMLEIGIQPSIYHFTELATSYARIGDIHRALAILSGVEKRLDADPDSLLFDEPALTISDSAADPLSGAIFEELPSNPEEEGGAEYESGDRPKASSIPLHFPQPDVVMYISMLRGCIRSRHLDGAKDVLDRLSKRHQHVPGDIPELDEVLDDFQRLQRSVERGRRGG